MDFAAATTEVTPADLVSATAAGGPPVLLDDDGAPAELVATADELTSGLGDFESALALQGYFREGFTYDETANYSGEDDPLSAFLDVRSGFCQQFSTAFALAARSVGLPTRVVVGFTTGDVSTTDEGATYAVWGRNAHAWPEVLFEGIGWVPFEPTPGRGDPSSTAITGVPAQQAEPPEQSTDQSVPDHRPRDHSRPRRTTPATDTPSGAAGTTPPEPGRVPDTRVGRFRGDSAMVVGVLVRGRAGEHRSDPSGSSTVTVPAARERPPTPCRIRGTSP